MIFSIKTMQSKCEICGKNRGIKGIHVRCSEIRQKRRLALEKKEKARHGDQQETA